MYAVPERFSRTLIELHGDAGKEWLHWLPELLSNCASRWSLELLPPFPNLTFNYVAPAIRSGERIVLKVGYPNPELTSEIEALRVYDGRGSVLLIDSDQEWGALVLERLEPGTPLASLDDDRAATSIAAQVILGLHRPPPYEHTFRSLADWTAGLRKLRPYFGGTTGPFPTHLVETAEALLQELLVSAPAPMLLHGDLHHHNILAATRQPWLALDPKGVVGDPTYEVAPFLYNPMPEIVGWSNLARIIERRIDQFAEELGFDRRRILGWGIAQAVLSAWWNVEDQGHGWEPALAVADILTSLSRGAYTSGLD